MEYILITVSSPVYFFGGLTSVFPGTSTVESYVSVIRYEKDDYRSLFTYFSLKGILQCKQLNLLSTMPTILIENTHLTFI
jgi:hypothetical protein